jgi:DNA adenine methylase
MVLELLKTNDLCAGEYAEPFAGGCGIAITLLLNDHVSRIRINDIDPAIHALWQAIIRHPDDLCERIERIPVTLEERDRQKAIFLGERAGTVVERGFATLFLNRTNRSGILRGGVIGGKEQNGTYKLDCRFNRDDLVRKVLNISAYRDRISLTRLDALAFIAQVVPKMGARALVNLDPPYFLRGRELYTNYYGEDDHVKLASAVSRLRQRWMVTYDDAPEIRRLYAKFPMYLSKLNYFAQDKRVGSELLILDPNLRLPRELRFDPITRP